MVYGGLGGALFLLPLQLQQVLGYSPLEAGTALLPMTLVHARPFGPGRQALAAHRPAAAHDVGPIVAGGGLAALSLVQAGTTYLSTFLPAIVCSRSAWRSPCRRSRRPCWPRRRVEHAGLASAVNNAVARAAGLIAVAVLPAAAGLSASSYLQPAVFGAGFRTAMWLAGGACALGGVISAFTIRREPAGGPAAEESSRFACPLDAPPWCGSEDGETGRGGPAERRPAA